MTGRVTLATVAAHAGVSVATASRALSGRGDLAPATRRRVLASARTLGFVRDPTAGGRPPGSARLLDLVLGSFHNSYSDEVTAGARSAAAAAGYDLVLTEERDSPDDDWPMRIRRRGSAGVVLGLIAPTASQLAALRDAEIPVVLMDPQAETSRGLTSVRTTDREGGVAAAAHLATRGATRFAIVVGLPAYRYGRARLEGFRAGLAVAHPDTEAVVVPADWGAAAAREGLIPLMRDLAASERLGVFACSDEMASGAYAAAAATGRRIPDDVLVVGFDDLRGARWLTPPLTTVRQPIREMAAAAVTALADAAAGAPLPPSPIVLPTRLIERGSA
ncbi:LacI family DNA-binding transcriptional regulator [Microbacterium sp. HD4P20]|uniref:LacI family DNA-binding transcriptional regulator n=1 Tax=Microbacterium sp. HD4P20 TaxID=2864874 RepID=UPI001C6422AC|nr:LacI family DNA-binding transcriptional regulator [Microbacterium sp. HD4P20]MCP2637928.1 LacI family DNA-binding transcriptional regulator [Microbacterium sp. HD4P20]